MTVLVEGTGRYASLTIEAPSLAGPLDRDSTLREWMNGPAGRQLIEREVAGGQPAAVLDDQHIEMIGNMPLSTLANSGMSLDHHAVDRVASGWREQDNVG